MLQNAYFLAKIGADTAENEQHFAEILPKIGNYPTGRLTPRAGRAAPWPGAGVPARLDEGGLSRGRQRCGRGEEGLTLPNATSIFFGVLVLRKKE